MDGAFIFMEGGEGCISAFCGTKCYTAAGRTRHWGQEPVGKIEIKLTIQQENFRAFDKEVLQKHIKHIGQEIDSN